jgi:hypothetical protein
MSVTHPDAAFAPPPQHAFADRHPQFAPFLLAMAILVVAVVGSLALTGLPG